MVIASAHVQHKPNLGKARKQMAMNRIVLVGGGVRSGKSRFALAYARGLGSRRVFVATAEAGDAEMGERILRHREERGPDFITIEESVKLSRVLAETHDVDVVVVDCLTLWVANLLARGEPAAEIEGRVDDLLATLAHRPFHVILVSNEVGLGVVPESALGRLFRDIVGRVHQQIAAKADEVYLAAMGMVIRLVPQPLRAFRPGEAP
jgi:adenosylcobinamide kinase / adenosylcobinamide-phosphate guanylyltransferase